MLPERVFAPSTAEVTLVLLAGKSHTGYLTRFNPAALDIALALTQTARADARFAVEQVAYVAFHRGAGDPPPPPSRRGALKIHVSGGKTFAVDPVEPSQPGTLGMYARPAEAQSPYREIFFYNHGINLREVNEPLGAMLLQEGRLAASGLEAGLRAQKDEKRTPIGQILVENKRINQNAVDQAALLQQRRGTRLGEVLVEAGLASAEDIDFALSEQRKRGGKRIGQILIEMNLISEVDLARALARKFQLTFLDLDGCSINLEAVTELPREFIEKHRV
ncbi:MAG TPA: hypothetical protein VFQ61_02125, partial [Polyangiaceae bacterium]|nr:hypothetical protein [Polyangiaceae bacterium]